MVGLEGRLADDKTKVRLRLLHKFLTRLQSPQSHEKKRKIEITLESILEYKGD